MPGWRAAEPLALVLQLPTIVNAASAAEHGRTGARKERERSIRNVAAKGGRYERAQDASPDGVRRDLQRGVRSLQAELRPVRRYRRGHLCSVLSAHGSG